MTSIIDEIQEISLDGFKVVSGDMFRAQPAHDKPSCTLWNDSISFSKSSIMALNCCERIHLEINPDKKCMLVVPVTAKDKDNLKWIKSEKGPQAKKITCRALMEMLYEKWGWELNHVYRTVGRLVTVENRVMLLYDFNGCENWVYKPRSKENE